MRWRHTTAAGAGLLSLALVLLVGSRDWAERILGATRRWLEGHLRLIASVIVVLLAVSLVRNGIAGLTG